MLMEAKIGNTVVIAIRMERLWAGSVAFYPWNETVREMEKEIKQ